MVLSSNVIRAESSSIVSVDAEIEEFDSAGETWLKVFQARSLDESVKYSQRISNWRF
jgi:hypothetical protein